jgi:hypothetical protein
MSSKENISVAGIKVHTNKPTNVAMHKLFGWVIWQFPRPKKKGYQGAVRPPETGSEWIPAVIRADKNRVKVYGNAGKTYPTPEKAVEFFQEKDNG